MIKVIVTNTAETRFNGPWGASFETMEEAVAWVQKQEAKFPCPWGEPGEYEVVYDSNDQSNAEAAFASLRAERDQLLKDTDFTQLADAPFDSATKSQYRDYRAYLRALPGAHNDITILNYTIDTFEEFTAE